MINNLPKDWKIVELNECGKIITGKTPSKKVNEYWNSNDISFIKPDDFTKNTIIEFERGRDFVSFEGFKKNPKIPPYSVLTTCIGNIGKVLINKNEATTNQQINSIIPNSNINYKYLAYAILKIKPIMIQKANSAVVPMINKTDFGKYTIPIPPLQQQEKIVKVLDLSSNLIEKQKELLEKYDLFLKSKFIEMFGDPIKNPIGWNYIKLSELGSFKNGLNFNYKENQHRIKCLGVGDFKNFTTIDNIEKLKTISIDNQPKNEYLLQNGDIIFVRSNGNKNLVGRCVEIYPNGKEITFSGFCIRLRLSSNLIIVSYLLQVLKSKSMRAKMVGRGANIQNLNQQILNGLDIPLPPIDIQNKFASIIEKLETIKEKENQKLKQLEDLHNSLMQKAFKGEIK